MSGVGSNILTLLQGDEVRIINLLCDIVREMELTSSGDTGAA
jgi:hypothetical protein